MQRDQCLRASGRRDEFDFHVGRRVDVHDGAQVAGFEARVGAVARQHHGIKFTEGDEASSG